MGLPTHTLLLVVAFSSDSEVFTFHETRPLNVWIFTFFKPQGTDGLAQECSESLIRTGGKKASISVYKSSNFIIHWSRVTRTKVDEECYHIFSTYWRVEIYHWKHTQFCKTYKPKFVTYLSVNYRCSDLLFVSLCLIRLSLYKHISTRV